MGLLAPALAALALVSSAEPADDQPAAEKANETRQSLSVSDEGSLAAALRVPGSDLRNLLLIQPSFAYKWKGRFRFSSGLAAFVKTQDETHAQLRFRETYVGLSAGELDVAAGKRLQRWGTGYAFTATGILDPPRSAADPTDRLNLNEGREMVQVDWIHGQHDVSVVWASAGLLQRHRPGMRETAALRYNALIGGFDTSAIVAYDRGGPAFVGGNFTRVVGQAIEVHSEIAWREGVAVLVGGKYTHGSGVSIIAELYTPPNSDYYRPGGMPAAAGRQHHGYLRISKSRLRELPGWKEWDVAASLVANLDDASRIAVLDAGRRFGNHLYAYTHAEAPGGKRSGSQYGKIPYSALISVGVRFQM
jgi:hypothetical protein